MAEEQPKTTLVEAQDTTAQDSAPETATEAPKADAESAEKPSTTDATSSDNKDSDMKDADVATAGPQATTEATAPDGGKTEAADLPSEVADATGTPSANKNGKRKSTGGVPEHKTKKLNKKKSTVQLNLDVNAGDYYWARLKGYPPWPSIVCDEEMLPESLLGNRPVSAKRPDGSYREDFADGGKNARDRTYPVMFLGTNEFSWMVNTSLTKLESGDCAEDKQTGKMSKALKGAYEVAEEGNDLQHFKDMLHEFMEAAKKQQEEEAAKQADKEAKAAKKQEKAEKAVAEKGTKEKKDRRKSKSKETISDEDDMELDVPEEAEAKPSKKRKKDADSEGESAKPKKTPKSIKITASKTPNGESSTKKAAAKPKKTVAKPDEEEAKDAPLTEAEKYERRDKAVLYLRHRLQKGFLTRDQAPKEEEMAVMADFFSQLEAYQDLEASIIRNTKIYKVLRGIIKLSSIPKEEEYRFKKRSSDMLSEWHKVIGSKGDEKDEEKTEQKENGEKDVKAEVSTETEDTKEPSAAPVETVTNLDNDATDEKDVAMSDAKDDKPEDKSEEPKEDAEEA